MTEPWTYGQHLAKAEELAHQSDELAEGEGPGSMAGQRRLDIQQTADRGKLHAKLAELKLMASLAEKPAEAPRGAPKPQARQQKGETT